MMITYYSYSNIIEKKLILSKACVKIKCMQVNKPRVNRARTAQKAQT